MSYSARSRGSDSSSLDLAPPTRTSSPGSAPPSPAPPPPPSPGGGLGLDAGPGAGLGGPPPTSGGASSGADLQGNSVAIDLVRAALERSVTQFDGAEVCRAILGILRDAGQDPEQEWQRAMRVAGSPESLPTFDEVNPDSAGLGLEGPTDGLAADLGPTDSLGTGSPGGLPSDLVEPAPEPLGLEPGLEPEAPLAGPGVPPEGPRGALRRAVAEGNRGRRPSTRGSSPGPNSPNSSPPGAF